MWHIDAAVILSSIWLVVYLYTPSEKYEFASWDDEIPNIWKKKHVPNHQPAINPWNPQFLSLHCQVFLPVSPWGLWPKHPPGWHRLPRSTLATSRLGTWKFCCGYIYMYIIIYTQYITYIYIYLLLYNIILTIWYIVYTPTLPLYSGPWKTWFARGWLCVHRLA